MELLAAVALYPSVRRHDHAGRARIAGDECRGGGRRLCHRVELSAQERRHCRQLETNDRLLAIIVQIFQRGEFNKIRLANKAIAKFEAALLV